MATLAVYVGVKCNTLLYFVVDQDFDVVDVDDVDSFAVVLFIYILS